MKNSFLSKCQWVFYSWLILVLVSWGCSSKPRISKNSPQYYYAEAKKAMSEIKYEKAISLIADIQSKFPQSEEANKARILRIVLLSGLSEGYANMAEAYISGFEKSIKNAAAFRSTGFDYYRKQKNSSLGFYEACDYFLKNFSAETAYVLDCEFPTKNYTPNKRLDEVRSGNLLDPEQRRVAEEDELQNGVISSLTGFLGAGADRAKARKLLEGGSKPLDHAEFMVMLGRTLLTEQKLFGRSALNEIQSYRQFYQKTSEFIDLALKILKDKPNQDVQTQADQLKTELQAQEKKRT